MKAKKDILLICGGGSSEHNISLISASFIAKKLRQMQDEYRLHYIEITPDQQRKTILDDSDSRQYGQNVELRRSGEIFYHQDQKSFQLHYVIPCIHGPPGEDGTIQSVFELMGLPYLGAAPEASQLCFNKVSTKLWLNALGIENTPFGFTHKNDEQQVEKAYQYFDKWNGLFIKAASQGSSIGCYLVTEREKVADYLKEALQYSHYIIFEKPLVARELEVAVYQYKGQIYAAGPGEIVLPKDEFYTFDQKYDNKSQTTTKLECSDLSNVLVKHIQQMAIEAFKGLAIKDLARVDFFLTQEQQGPKIYLNEINTFPGMTPISMFPKLMEHNGLDFSEFIKWHIERH